MAEYPRGIRQAVVFLLVALTLVATQPTLAASVLTPRWTSQVLAGSYLSPYVYDALYLATGDGYVHSLNLKNGQEIKYAYVEPPLAYSGYGGYHAVGSQYGAVTLFYKTTKVWVKYMQDEVWALAVTNDKVAAGDASGMVSCFDLKGNILWNRVLDDAVISMRFVGAYLVTSDASGKLTAFDSQGNDAWSVSLGSIGWFIATDGANLYVSSDEQAIYKVSNTGKILAKKSVNGVPGMAEVSSGQLYFGTDAGYFYIMTTTLSTIASSYVGGSIEGKPVVYGGLVYVPNIKGNIYVLDSYGKRSATLYTGQLVSSLMPVYRSGTFDAIVAIDTSGKVYSFGVPITLKFYLGRAYYLRNNVTYTLDAAPEIRWDRTFVPLRAVAEELGYQVWWDATAQRVTLTKSGKTVYLYIGSNVAYVDGKATPIDANSAVAPYIKSGRTMVPLRFISEAIGAKVSWDAVERSVTVQP
ncbi:PQQ-binding-like beta-propeller repeat protein [Coprothermobacteraceae bacterium]|nr:PQQ-binding-like beta-propeller repeat protein [Coprothermobacteraceae bacterium]